MMMKLKASTRQVDQLKEEIKEKDIALEKAQVEFQQSEDERKSMKVRPLAQMFSCKVWFPRLHCVLTFGSCFAVF